MEMKKRNMISNDEIIGYDALWESMLKCQKSVRWKPAVKDFIINSPELIHSMHARLANGTWIDGTPRPIKIMYPKKRDGLSISFTDRIYQRSINDNVLYPEMTKHFIYDNSACQIGKGPRFARRRVKEQLWNYYCNHGAYGYVLRIDITQYFKSIQHNLAMTTVSKYVLRDTCDSISNILEKQHVNGGSGYNPGSQMVQIVALSILNSVDHYIKEKLHIKVYHRYNDDLFMVHESKEYLEYCLECITDIFESLGFKINRKKTLITKLTDGFNFLGFTYHMTNTGKIITIVNSENVKHERQKLKRMVAKSKRGELPKSKVDESFNGWKTYVSEGNSTKLIWKMDKYYSQLWRS